MRVLIIEDEELAAEKLEGLVKELVPSVKIVGKTTSIKDSVSWLMNNKADLIFLDIQLSDGISFSIFEQLRVETPVIFTTAYDQYAIKAFQLNSISYLLKPVRKTDLEKSLSKYEELKSAFGINFDMLLEQIQSKQPAYKERFLVQVGEKIRKIETGEIAYFYVMQKGVYLKTREGSSYPVEYSLDRLENLLNPAAFFRINRKYIVNVDGIAKMIAYSRGRVKLELKPPADDDDSIVSIERAAKFKSWLGA